MFQGTIPSQLGALSRLRHFVLSQVGGDQLSGTIPPQLGSLSSLTFLSFSIAKLSGIIPPELGSLSNLRTLEMSGPMMSGIIPPELGSLSNLEVFSAYNTRLVGTIPPQLSALSRLQQLFISLNPLLSGTIPPELGLMTGFNSFTTTIVDLSQNKLSGTIPPQLGSLSQVAYLSLNNNFLVGTIPPQLGSMARMIRLVLSQNKLSGTIPPQLGSLSSLSNMNLFNNSLVGTIPLELNSIPRNLYLDVSYNALICGPFASSTFARTVVRDGTYGFTCPPCFTTSFTPNWNCTPTTPFCLNNSTCVGCASNADCTDNLFCNGVETCVSGRCTAGTPPSCDDSIACTTDSCDGNQNKCVHVTENARCSDGLFCNGVETCDAAEGCKPGTPPSCDDSIACTTDSCDGNQNKCVHVTENARCSDGLFCNGVETCDAAEGCKPGTPPSCDDSIACTTDSCDGDQNKCVHVTENARCSDGLFCNGVETCDAAEGCKPGTPPSCDDSIACTTDSCDGNQNKCVHVTENARCSDGLFCNGVETCDAAEGCKPGTPPSCDDSIACTTDSCDGDQNKCVHVTENARCSDGLFCNGVETCDAAEGCKPGTPPSCDDSIACTTDSCDGDQNKCVHVTENARCSDGLFCNGVETCDAAEGCKPGTPPSCDDSIACTTDSCDGDQNKCVHVTENARCSDGLFCNGVETCDAAEGCKPGTPPSCDDSIACTTDSCDGDQNKCVHVTENARCSDGLFCNGVETCDAAEGCKPGTPPSCDDSIACTTDSCDGDQNKCVHVTENARCSDGLFCNGVETCDAAEGCKPGTPPSCDDSIACTTDSCDGDQNKCVHVTENARCSDGLFCNGVETCDAAEGCKPGTPPSCDDSIACTTDSCDGNQNKCVHVTENSRCSDGLFCNGVETCDAAEGCKPGTPPSCDDSIACTTDSCDGDQNKCVHVTENARCSDGLFCNGVETCDAAEGCKPGTPPSCDDSIACTTDSCDGDQNKCVHVTENARCSDGLFCNGVETCDAAEGCKPGTPPSCDDSIACTTDSCDGDQNKCVHVTENARCSDGLFCNGVETCDAAEGCKPGTPPSCDDSIACTTDSCDGDQNKCVHVTENARCSDGLFCNGVETCDAAEGCKPGTPPSCDDSIACTTDSCDGDQNKCVHVTENARCSDGLFCNGVETCDAAEGCKPGTPPSCDDSIACTTDSCDGDQNKCVHVTENARCSDGLFCNGVETCDAAEGCKPGTPPSCDDSIACTTDSCDGDQNKCVHVTENARCSDGLFCNGVETCDAAEGCKPGTPPSCDDSIVCTHDVCDPYYDECVYTDIPCACQTHLECGPNKCCCGSSCKPKPDGVDCDFFCANEACKSKGWSGVSCACIKDCQGPWCSSAGGNPCQQHGVCCCAGGPRKSMGALVGTFQEKCKSCDQDCIGHNCAGNYVPGPLSSMCAQRF
eukprot:jgi/Mesvir1/25421/Mv25775-RA.3